MALLLDSLGQCVSALSKRFAAAESIRDTVNCTPHSHREKHSEIRHRKDTHHQQEDAPKPKVVDLCLPAVCSLKCTRSVLWVYSSSAVSDAGNQWQSPHLHSKEAKSQLRVRHRTQPQTERWTEGSIQGARDHSTWWENRQVNSLSHVQPAQTTGENMLPSGAFYNSTELVQWLHITHIFCSSALTKVYIIRKCIHTVTIWMSFLLFIKKKFLEMLAIPACRGTLDPYVTAACTWQ